MITKILIANRGEIARRVIRTSRALGYRTVAVYSEADAAAPHVEEADEAVCLGPAAASESYLRIDKLLAAARATGADAVHPGYGFLSENAAFAEACAGAGLVFIGPPPEAIRAMGDKARAKARMEAAGVPTAPGYLGEDQSPARFQAEAERIGFPLMVKAVAGGGGRGIRVVAEAAELRAALESARAEAQSSFGDGTLLLERRIEGGRHVELQVFADAHGNAVHLGERDCTAQRRRQKVIEEAPSPLVDEALRARMGAAAVAAAKAVGYRGAGTVEFMLDQEGRYFFLEMNTRLQVEHPVTELVYGVDLVAWQLAVAEGRPLPLAQEQLVPRGHAIEARLYAEDPYAGFRPQTGTVLGFDPGAVTGRPGVRIDAGVRAGGEVTPHYDAMVAKVIAHGSDRAEAIRRLCLALEDCPLLGLRNNGGFLVRLLRSAEFGGARLTTTTLDRWVEEGAPLIRAPVASDEAWALAAALFTQGGDWLRTTAPLAFTLLLELQGGEKSEPRALRVVRTAHEAQVTLPSGAAHTVLLHGRTDGDRVRYRFDGVDRSALRGAGGGTLHLALGGDQFQFAEPSPLRRDAAKDDPRRLLSPLAGVVTRLLVTPGQAVAAGETLATVEAMKMETRLVARAAGTVSRLHTSLGQQVTAGALLFELEPAAAPAATG